MRSTNLGRELLTWGLATSGLACGLLKEESVKGQESGVEVEAMRLRP